MAYGILAGDDGPIFEAGGDVVGEVADDAREDCGAGFVHVADKGEKVDGGFKAAREKAGACKEQVAN